MKKRVNNYKKKKLNNGTIAIFYGDLYSFYGRKKKFYKVVKKTENAENGFKNVITRICM